jgi:hypothetical protein
LGNDYTYSIVIAVEIAATNNCEHLKLIIK